MATAASAREGRGAKTGDLGWPRALTWVLLGCVLVGLGWRVTRFLVGFPVWGDEAMVLVDVVDRDYCGLTQTLSKVQVAPLVFLWGEKATISALDTSEFAVRLFPLLAGSLGLAMFAGLCRYWLTPVHGTLALAVLAVSYFPLRHCVEVKPYSLDLLMSVGLLAGTIGWLNDTRRTAWLVFLALWGPLAMLASYPAPFVGGAMSLVLLPKMWHATWKARTLFAIYNVLIVAAFLGHYLGVARHQIDAPQAQVTHDHMDSAWNDSFPPASLIEFPIWLVRIHSGLMLAYPLGGSNGGSTVPMLLCLLGAWRLWRSGKCSLLLACVLPFGLTMFAAFLHKYPYGGSARVAQHLAPMACILIAAGGAALLERLRTPTARVHLTCAVCLAIAAIGLGGAVRDIMRPYKTDYDRHVRQLVRDFWSRVEPGDVVVIGQSPVELPPVVEWYLRYDRHALTRVVPAGRPVPEGRCIWLWHTSLYPAPASAAAWSLGEVGRGFTVVEARSHMLPIDSPGDPPLCCNVFRLAR